MAAFAASADGSESGQRIAGASKAATTEQRETPLMQQRPSLNDYAVTALLCCSIPIAYSTGALF